MPEIIYLSQNFGNDINMIMRKNVKSTFNQNESYSIKL